MAPLNRPTVTSNAGCNKHCCRESLDFDSVSAYQTCIDSVVEQLNIPCLDKLQQERPHLQQLPTHRYLDYEILSVKVTCHSTITVRCTFTVPSRLIGQRLTIYLYHDHLRFVGTKQVVELPRMCLAHLTAAVPVASIATSLTPGKPGVAQCVWQQELLPNEHYRQLWQQLRAQFDPTKLLA